jgi:hypothetical protein
VGISDKAEAEHRKADDQLHSEGGRSLNSVLQLLAFYGDSTLIETKLWHRNYNLNNCQSFLKMENSTKINRQRQRLLVGAIVP